jgi:single-strand DNA-binding protein
MAWDINNTILVGRLTNDPDFTMTKNNNTPICKFSIANNRGNGDSAETVSFFNIIAWKKTAELCNQYLKKGSQVVIEGTLRQNRFQDQNGQNRSRVEIVANNVQFIGSSQQQTQSGNGGGFNQQPSGNQGFGGNASPNGQGGFNVDGPNFFFDEAFDDHKLP